MSYIATQWYQNLNFGQVCPNPKFYLMRSHVHTLSELDSSLIACPGSHLQGPNYTFTLSSNCCQAMELASTGGSCIPRKAPIIRALMYYVLTAFSNSNFCVMHCNNQTQCDNYLSMLLFVLIILIISGYLTCISYCYFLYPIIRFNIIMVYWEKKVRSLKI